MSSWPNWSWSKRVCNLNTKSFNLQTACLPLSICLRWDQKFFHECKISTSKTNNLTSRVFSNWINVITRTQRSNVLLVNVVAAQMERFTTIDVRKNFWTCWSGNYWALNKVWCVVNLPKTSLQSRKKINRLLKIDVVNNQQSTRIFSQKLWQHNSNGLWSL